MDVRDLDLAYGRAASARTHGHASRWASTVISVVSHGDRLPARKDLRLTLCAMGATSYLPPGK